MVIDPGADSPASTDHMLVDPDKLEQLKSGLEEELFRVRDWLLANRPALFKIDPPGLDPCSRDTMQVMEQQGQTAIGKVDAYVSRLRLVAEKLLESAGAYGATEDHNAAAFRQQPQ